VGLTAYGRRSKSGETPDRAADSAGRLESIDCYRWPRIRSSVLRYPILLHGTPLHSHSIVPGGLLVTSYTTRSTSFTSLMIRVATPQKRHVEWIEIRRYAIGRRHDIDGVVASVCRPLQRCRWTLRMSVDRGEPEAQPTAKVI